VVHIDHLVPIQEVEYLQMVAPAEADRPGDSAQAECRWPGQGDATEVSDAQESPGRLAAVRRSDVVRSFPGGASSGQDGAVSGRVADHLRVEVVFSDDDLARVRLSSRLELVSEVIGAAHQQHSQLQPSLRGWGQHTGEALGPIGAQVIRDLRSGTFLISGLMTYADIDTDDGFDDRLETSLSRPTAEWGTYDNFDRGAYQSSPASPKGTRMHYPRWPGRLGCFMMRRSPRTGSGCSLLPSLRRWRGSTP
jgi:hypothetical protein